MVRHDLATLGVGPVEALLDARIIGKGDAQLLAAVDEQMAVARLLLEEEPGCGHAMVQRDGLDQQRLVLIDHLALRWVVGLEGDGHGEVGAEIVEQRTEHPLGIGMRMDHNLARALTQAQGGYQADEAQTVVAMQVTEQYVPNLTYGYAVAAQPNLHPFSAIYQEQVATKVDDLTGG